MSSAMRPRPVSSLYATTAQLLRSISILFGVAPAQEHEPGLHLWRAAVRISAHPYGQFLETMDTRERPEALGPARVPRGGMPFQKQKPRLRQHRAVALQKIIFGALDIELYQIVRRRQRRQKVLSRKRPDPRILITCLRRSRQRRRHVGTFLEALGTGVLADNAVP